MATAVGMGPLLGKLQLAIALLSALGTVKGQNGTGPDAAGPAWNHADYTTSPPVYPERE